MAITGLIFEGKFNKGICSRVGKLMFPNGDLYFGQHRGFQREGWGKIIYFNGSEF